MTERFSGARRGSLFLLYLLAAWSFAASAQTADPLPLWNDGAAK